MLAARSITDDALCPTDTANYVRGRVLISGATLTPGPNGVEIVYIFQVDPCGWIPTYLVNKANEWQPFGIIGRRVSSASVLMREKKTGSVCEERVSGGLTQGVRKLLTGSPKP